jgi:ATP-dependent Clp protease adaptor protein ClpS
MTNEHATEQAREPLLPAALEQHLIEDHIVEEQLVETVRTATGNLCKIIVHNDDVTPYDYVINILGDLFMLSEELADHVAWTAHMKGVAVVVVRPRAEAEKLVKVAHGRARSSSYPLTFSLEQE